MLAIFTFVVGVFTFLVARTLHRAGFDRDESIPDISRRTRLDYVGELVLLALWVYAWRGLFR